MDVRDGRIVKGVRFQGLRDAGDPVERARLYAEQGADELVMLDVSATVEGRRARVDVIRRVRAEVGLPLIVGGGIRTADDAAVLLEAGADKVSVNSAAVRRPGLLTELSERFGRQCTVLAVDAARRTSGEGWEITVSGGRERVPTDAIDWIARGADAGAGEVLLTSWDRDGTGDGYDLELLAAARKRVDIPIIASGGAARPEHLADAVDAGADAVLAASIFHDGNWQVDTLKDELTRLNLEIRR
jgi:imidazoleglycerol phosphate synthase cyclase subunit